MNGRAGARRSPYGPNSTCFAASSDVKLDIWTRPRTIDTGFATNENIIDIRVKRLF